MLYNSFASESFFAIFATHKSFYMYYKITIFILCLFQATMLRAQSDDVQLTPEQTKKVVTEVCRCFDDTAQYDSFEEKDAAMKTCMGLTMLKSLKEFGIGVDVDNLNEESGRALGEKFGRKIGVQLAIDCPSFAK